MPAFFIFEEGDALALHSLGNNTRWRTIALNSLCICLVDFFVVMSVNDDGVPTKATSTSCICIRIPAKISLTALSQTVHVDDCNEVIELVVGCLIETFPDGAFRHFAITTQDPDVIGQLVKIFSCQRNAYTNRQALPKRTCCDIDPWEKRCWVSLHAAAKFAQGQKFFVFDCACCFVH